MFSLRQATAAVMLVFVAAVSGVVHAADADPSMSQVYDAARTGHLAEAQQMMDQVLRDHPQSAKAHYVAAEVDARAGNFALARQELNTAQSLEPGLPFTPPGAIVALRSEIAQGTTRRMAMPATAAHATFPWLPVLLIGAGLAIFWMLVRARARQAVIPTQYPGSAGYPGGYAGGMPMGGPMGGGVGFPGVVGGGSGLVGGLASGLAVGAGMAAGEELVRHVFAGDRAMGQVAPEREFIEPAQDPNAAMGGNEFGVSDSSSWDDSSGSSWGDGGGSGGGGDWT
ncbi:MAG TPA: tetratricopeptide repeat protein [Steroidobacteraceae bacterium]|nr:tetratricopeptide repeat protein [Steroidobacteraceae bacterium]